MRPLWGLGLEPALREALHELLFPEAADRPAAHTGFTGIAPPQPSPRPRPAFAAVRSL